MYIDFFIFSYFYLILFFFLSTFAIFFRFETKQSNRGVFFSARGIEVASVSLYSIFYENQNGGICSDFS